MLLFASRCRRPRPLRRHAGTPNGVEHDGRGNQTERRVLGGETTYFGYNSRNLLTTITSTDPAFTANYFEYNALGQRVRKSDSTGTTVYVWDGLNIILELDEQGAVQRRYTHGHTSIHGVFSLISVQDRLGCRYCYHMDQVGGIHRLTDAWGNVIKSYEFSPYGRILEESGGAPNELSTPGTYTMPHDLPTHRVSPRRFCDTSTGRFNQRDPARSDMNGYLAPFAPGLVDPTGLNGIGYVPPIVDPTEPARKMAAISRAMDEWCDFNVRIPGQHHEFWHEWPPEKRERWFERFRRRYGDLILSAARRHCVPAGLLAAVIANEQIDYSLGEQLIENTMATEDWARRRGLALSVGVAQIRVERALEYGAIDPTVFRQVTGKRYDPQTKQVPRYRPTTFHVSTEEQLRAYLSDPRGSIDAAARLLKAFMEDLCQKILERRPFSASFMQEIYGRDFFLESEVREVCCKRLSCEEIVLMRVSGELIAAMSLYWNANPDIIKEPDLGGKAHWQALRMGQYGYNLRGVFDDLARKAGR